MITFNLHLNLNLKLLEKRQDVSHKLWVTVVTADLIELLFQSISYGLVGVRTQDTSKDFKQPLVIAYFGVDYKKNPKGTNYWRNRILKVAQSFKDYTFAISSKDEFQYEMNEYGIDFVPSEKPIVTAKNAKGQKFILKEEFS